MKLRTQKCFHGLKYQAEFNRLNTLIVYTEALRQQRCESQNMEPEVVQNYTTFFNQCRQDFNLTLGAMRELTWLKAGTMFNLEHGLLESSARQQVAIYAELQAGFWNIMQEMFRQAEPNVQHDMVECVEQWRQHTQANYAQGAPYRNDPRRSPLDVQRDVCRYGAVFALLKNLAHVMSQVNGRECACSR